MTAVGPSSASQLNVEDEIRRIRQQLETLAASGDENLARYELRWPPMPSGTYWRIRWLAGWGFRWLESMRLKKLDAWPAALRHSPCNAHAKPYLIWAVGTERETLRDACSGLVEIDAGLPGLVPVLVTDVPDFAFFSRLGWLVEYVPEISGAGASFARRKERFIARLYRNAPVVPVAVGLHAREHADEIRRLVLNTSRLR